MTRQSLAVAVAYYLCTAIPTLAGDAPERIGADKAKKIVAPLLEATAKLELPLKLTLDGERGTGLKAGKAVLFIIPDSKLTVESLKKLDKEPLPLGVLFAYKVTPITAEQAIAADQHRTVEITVGTDNATVTVLPLAAARIAGRLVLLVYTKDKIPAIVAELVEADEKSDWPLDLDGRQVGNNRAALVVNVLGRYRAAIQVAGQE